MEKDTFLQRVGKEIAKMRAKNGYTQKEFADIVGLSRMQLHRLEKGETNTTIWLLMQISEALDVKLTDLIYEKK